MSRSDTPRIIVVGASAAGLRAAARARRLLPGARVLVIDQDAFISYAACGMPYFLSGDIESPAKLRETAYGVIRDPDFFRAAKDLEVLTQTRVEGIDRAGKQVRCKSLETGEETVHPYDKLVLATGAAPVMLPGVAADSPRITTFKTLHQAMQLRQQLQKGEIGRVGIVGGGYIGCELAEAFGSLWGAEVVMIEAAPQILPWLLDREMARAVESYLESEGVELRIGCPVEGIEDTGEGVVIKSKDGPVEADCAVVAVGVKPGTALAAEAGLDLGERGGIKVDGSLRTSDPDILAAGDCIEVENRVSGRPMLLPLGSLANRQGRVIGSVLGGKDERFEPVVGSSAVKIFDLNVACTGLTEAAAGAAGFDPGCAWGTFTDRADYYPESENLHLKLVFDRGTRKLLGLQGYSKGEVVKRVDVFAALLKKGGTLEDLLDAEFAYAPPFAPAVDPLFSLASAAQNALEDGLEGLSPDLPHEGRVVVDVRRPEEVEAAPFPGEGVLNIPFEELRQRWEEIPRGKAVLLVCSKGLRSSESVRILKEKGISDAVYLGGGLFMKIN